MGDALTITARFLQPYSHGRGEDGSPEWPPSPLRLFQALVAPALGCAPDPATRQRSVEALRWLEQQAPPEIVAPRGDTTVGYRLFVPDNVGDRLARSWAAGRAGEIADYRTEKDVQAVRLSGDDGAHAVHYVFRDVGGLPRHFDTLQAAARRMTHLGWGIDLIVGDAVFGAATGSGERWLPGRGGMGALRCPVPGTLDALERKHQQFLTRIEGDRFRPVSPLTMLRALPYARATDPLRRPFAAFRLLDPETGRMLWLDPRRHSRNVAAWLRHAVDEVTTGWPFGSNSVVVHGHANADAPAHRARFSYLPLPSITPMGTESIARALVVGVPGLEPHLDWIRGRLAGIEVSWGGDRKVLLEPLPTSDAVLRKYLAESDRWSTVTPVVLPGHDGGSQRKVEGLLLKAFRQAGLDPAWIGAIRKLEWRDVGFRRGLHRARDYTRPDKIHGPMVHVQVGFSGKFAGPLAIGSGRHRGLGLFAAAE